MSRVIHFEFSGENPEQLAQFYRSVFDWKIANWGGPVHYWLISTGKEGESGIDGAIKQQDAAGQRTVVTVDVASVDETLKRISLAGGRVLTPKEAIPGIGFHAYATDPEGTIFGILEQNETAA